MMLLPNIFSVVNLFGANGDVRDRIAIDSNNNLSVLGVGEKSPTVIRKAYLWAAWDGCMPHITGITTSLHEAKRIAEQYGFDNFDANPMTESNQRLMVYLSDTGRVVSCMKRQTGRYAFGCWQSNAHFILGCAPIFYDDNLAPDKLRDMVVEYSPYKEFAGPCRSAEVDLFIRRREAMRHFDKPPSGDADAPCTVEFVYADHNECLYTKKKNWQRHRIIKITDKIVYVDRYPFQPKSYLRRGWQSRIVFTVMLDKATFERDGEFYHRTHLTTFYSEKTVRRKRWRRPTGNDDTVIELPSNAVKWALNKLDIKAWPSTVEAVKRAFAKKAMEHHPDRGGSANDFIQCRAAREFLLDMCDS